MSARPLVVTVGEPAGIGPDICLAIAQRPWKRPLVFIGDPEQLERRAAALSLDVSISDDLSKQKAGTVCVHAIDLPNKEVAGTPDPANAEAVLQSLQIAVSGCLNSDYAGLVTAPLQKSAINDAGISFSGHTEFLADLTGTPRPVMLLVAGELRVALVTTHLPLRAVPDAIDAERICEVARVLHSDLVERFAIRDPQIIVCGLNPHAGEGGYLGTEDQEEIAPAIDTLKNENINVRGPMPADTAFTPAAGRADAILAMYHDQGLPALKQAGFGNAINVTLGLPIIRTSVDHGTGLDIAASGRADTGSMRAAIELADRLAEP